MEVKKTFITGLTSLKRIVLRPQISDLFIKSIHVTSVEGETIQLDVSPFILEEDTVVSNTVSSAVSVTIVMMHDFITEDIDVSDYLIVDMSRSNTHQNAVLATKPVKIMVKSLISPILKMEGAAGVIVSASIGIRGFDEFDTEVFNSSVKIGLGESRELISIGNKLEYDAESVRMFMDGILSTDEIEHKDGVILNYDPNAIYIYSPKYLHIHIQTTIDDYISIDNNNNIILSKNIKYAECSIRADILDADMSSPVIKYIGVISR